MHLICRIYFPNLKLLSRAHGIFLNVPAVLGWDHSLLASKKTIGGSVVVLTNVGKPHLKIQARSSSLATQWSSSSLACKLSSSSEHLKPTLLSVLKEANKNASFKCQLHSIKTTTGWWICGFALGESPPPQSFHSHILSLRNSMILNYRLREANNFNPSWRNSSKWDHGNSKRKNFDSLI